MSNHVTIKWLYPKDRKYVCLYPFPVISVLTLILSLILLRLFLQLLKLPQPRLLQLPCFHLLPFCLQSVLHIMFLQSVSRRISMIRSNKGLLLIVSLQPPCLLIYNPLFFSTFNSCSKKSICVLCAICVTCSRELVFINT